MKNILLIGVGGTGSSAVDALYYKLREMGNNAENNIKALVFDTDIGSISGITEARSISMADTAGVGAVCDRLGEKAVSEWFPYLEPSVRAQDLTYGASQWRKKSYLAFLNAMNKQASYTTFVRALEDVGQDPSDACEIYVIASIAGGTGSGSFIPVALFAKRYLREKMNREPIVNAMIALPEIYEESQSPDNRVKIYANAYAILRELNAINLVARGYNREIRDGIDGGKTKKAPIRFTIGSHVIRNVGVLFDASNPAYWTPHAAPFNQVFMLDRMPSVHSIHAHDIILANSMYAIIGTQMGARFQSVQNNAATLLSQNNGGNAIYAGISTAELRFPRDSILNYLAHEKAYRSCEDEWLLLHRATEDAIREQEELARESKKRFMMGDGKYASMFLNELDNQYHTPTGNVTDLVDRTTAVYDEEGRKTQSATADLYFDKLIAALGGRLKGTSETSGKDIESMITSMKFEKAPNFFQRQFKRTAMRNTVAENAEQLAEAMLGCFSESVNLIRTSSTSLVDAILTVKKDKDLFANPDLSLVMNILMKDGKYIHPVAAMVQLCRFKLKLTAYLSSKKRSEWPEIKNGAVETLPADLLRSSATPDEVKGLKHKKSAYANIGEERFAQLAQSTDEYRRMKTDPFTDNAYLLADAAQCLETLRLRSKEQFAYAVLTRVSRCVDGLIEKYREFFHRFEDARQDLAEAVKTTRRRDAGRVDSVLNVYSSEEEKDILLKTVVGAAIEDEAEVAANENITGSSVFSLCYNQLSAEITNDLSRMESATVSFTSLFDGMVKNYAATIAGSSQFKELAKLDIFRAVWNSSLLKKEDPEAALRSYLSKALDIAKPSLLVDTRPRKDDTVQPQEILVAMLSTETARHIRLDADRYGITVMSNGATEQVILESCAEQFLKLYTGHDALSVAVVPGVPDNVLYVTGEKTNIMPLRIAKFDEMSNTPTYFNYYQEALANSIRFETDMWNPHIGFNLQRRGYLPYMNPAMEQKCDEELVKALFYALGNNLITYKERRGNVRGSFRLLAGGADKMLLTGEGKIIDKNNQAQLVSWLRCQDEYVKEWSALFDRDMETQLRNLPMIITDSQRSRLEMMLTRSPFIRMLRNSFFSDLSKSKAADADKDGGIGILEFAFGVKSSEEASRDCNDAERILHTAYRLFLDMIGYRINRDANPVLFYQVYMQQLEELFVALAKGTTVKREKTPSSNENAITMYHHIVSWVNDNDTFMAIPDSLFGDNGILLIDEPFRETPKVLAELARPLSESEIDTLSGDEI